MIVNTGASAAEPDVVLDLSRLLSRVLRTTPTGVDRVEFTYARELGRRIPDRIFFGARFPYGMYGRLEHGAVQRFLEHTAALWQGDGTDQRAIAVVAARHLLALRPRRVPPPTRPRIFLQVSPHQLDRPGRLQAILRREEARFVTMVHDLIPIEHPEYARPNGAEQHRRRIAAVARMADGIVANSAATRDALTPLLVGGRSPAVTVAHLGTAVHDPDPSSAVADTPPYFICVGTIEPRKNHLLLLNVWRRLVEQRGDAAPILHLVGKRGWENEQVVDMLERCVVLRGKVFEHSKMSDRAMVRLMRGARALLLPSFAEGFGMPVAEALAAGVPVIASNIAALREVGADAPDYLDPIDGPAWLKAISEYAQPESPRRAGQLARMEHWRPATWSDHVDAVLKLVSSL